MPSDVKPGGNGAGGTDKNQIQFYNFNWFQCNIVISYININIGIIRYYCTSVEKLLTSWKRVILIFCNKQMNNYISIIIVIIHLLR